VQIDCQVADRQRLGGLAHTRYRADHEQANQPRKQQTKNSIKKFINRI
jgi:hypothetical protein